MFLSYKNIGGCLLLLLFVVNFHVVVVNSVSLASVSLLPTNGSATTAQINLPQRFEGVYRDIMAQVANNSYRTMKPTATAFAFNLTELESQPFWKEVEMSSSALKAIIKGKWLPWLIEEFEGKSKASISTPSSIEKSMEDIFLKRSGIATRWECTTCKRIWGIAQEIFRRTASLDLINNLATFTCIKMGYTSEYICPKIVRQYSGVILTIVENTIFSPETFCMEIGCCPKSQDPPFEVTFPKPFPTTSRPYLPPIDTSKLVSFIHFSDFHVDLDYKVNSEAACTMPLCCRANSYIGNGAPPGVIKRPAGYWGDYQCDIPLVTAESALKTMVEKLPNFLFTLMSGDLLPHQVWDQKPSDSRRYLEASVALFNATFASKGLKMYSPLGNHEGAPCNLFPYGNMTQNTRWLYQLAAQKWGPQGAGWLPAEALTTLMRSGFYSVRQVPRAPRLRIIVLNTNFCYNLNFWLYMRPNDRDPDGMLKWLINELQLAEDAKDFVYIVGHSPPGVSDCRPLWATSYTKIVNRYSDTISGQFFGHTHWDHFEVFYATSTPTASTATNIAFISPSVTTFTYLNPGFKVFKVDPRNYHVVDIETWTMDLVKANQNGPKVAPVWSKEYSFRQMYNIPQITPSSLHTLTRTMEKDDSVFQKAYRLYWKNTTNIDNSPEGMPVCEGTCKSKFICAFRSSYNTYNCR